MSTTRFLLGGLLKLSVAAASLVGAIAAYKLVVLRWAAAAFPMDKDAWSAIKHAGMFAVVVLSYWGFVRLVERRAVRELAVRWNWTLLGAGAGAVSIGVTILALFATGHYQLVATRAAGPAAGVLVVLAIAAVLEEVAFRAILFRLLEERIGTTAAVVASALVFGVAHMTNNGAGRITLLTVTLAGVMWACVYILSRNVWVTAAHHLCWNATIFAIGLPLSGESDWRALAPLETTYRGSTLWTGGGFGPEDSLINVVVSTVICLALWRFVVRRGLEVPPGLPRSHVQPPVPRAAAS